MMKPSVYEPRLWTNGPLLYIPAGGNSAAGRGLGPDWASDGVSAVSHPALTNSFLGQMPRTNFQNAGTGTNQELGIHNPNAAWAWRGDAISRGGFFFGARFVVNLLPANCRLFVGLSANTTTGVCKGNLAAMPNNTIGLWCDTGDANDLVIMSKDNAGVTTPTTLKLSNGTPSQLALTTGFEYEFVIICNPFQNSIVTLLYDVLADNYLRGQNPTGLPINTAFMTPHIGLSNGTANTTAGTVSFDVISAYLRTNLFPVPQG